MSEITTYITARQFCEKQNIAPDTARMRYAKLLESKPELFNSPWRIDAPLSSEQVKALIAAGERIGGGAKTAKAKVDFIEGIECKTCLGTGKVILSADDLHSDKRHECPVCKGAGKVFPASQLYGYHNPDESKSQPTDKQDQAVKAKVELNKTPLQKGLLIGVCALCAIASVSNMLDISMQIKGLFWAACVITSIFTLSPFAVFYAGVKPGISWFVSGICIVYEVFCNSVGIYRGLANLGKGSPYEVWEPGGFIDSVSRVTTFEARPCALTVSCAMAGIIAGLFLVCLIELKKS